MPKSKKVEDAKAQHAKFIKAAKAAECDDDEQRFAERVKKIAASQPSKGKEAKK
jgi:hypothetical protein